VPRRWSRVVADQPHLLDFQIILGKGATSSRTIHKF
jgi:hypothetical protein